MIDSRIAHRLRLVARRLQRLHFSIAMTLGTLLLASILAPSLWSPATRAALLSRLPLPVTWLVVAGSLLVIVSSFIYSLLVTRDRRAIARRIENRFPDLNARLLTALDVRTAEPTGDYSFLEQRVLRETLQHDFRQGWQRLVPGTRLWLSQAMSITSLGALFVLAWLVDVAPTATQPSAENVLPVTVAGIAVEVEPGNAEVEKGSSVLVTARFRGPLPPQVELWARGEDAAETLLPMHKSLDDPLFGARLPPVNQPLAYRVQFAGRQSETYTLRVFELPRLQRIDAELAPPQYTGLPARQVRDIRRLTAVEGTELTVTCHVNKPLRTARLRSPQGTSIVLQPVPDQPLEYRATWVLQETARYQVQLEDDQGRRQPEPLAELIVVATQNRPPEFKLTAPGRDTSVSPLEELQLSGTVEDDFGVLRYGISYRLAGLDEQEITLAAEPTRLQAVQYLLNCEELDAKPDQLLAYHLWAEDSGPDGRPRRTRSDMYFAEVRHFEEVFRQGSAANAGGAMSSSGGNQQQAEQLLEMQKQIVNATWRLVRREIHAAPTPSFAADVKVVHESQQSALALLDALGEQLRDSESLTYLEETRAAMQEALEQLSTAAAPQVDVLPRALSAEQSAYQGLLRLRAREHEVVRSQSSSSSSSSGGSSPSQQQLQQLELDDSQNRYETERQAQQPEDPAARQLRQALSRLRELARRQRDVNEQLKQLQSALEQAADQQQREELERQLKRLREEQEQILRDTDELQQRMEEQSQQPDQESLAAERRQLAETRENVLQTSEALQQGRVSQAIASGTRAQREIEELQESLRKKTSSEFEQQMREMRAEARQLSETQKQATEQMSELTEQESQSLRGSAQREQLQQTLDQQSERLTRLLDEMRDVVQQAETSEPLLSSRLYEAHRQAQQDRPEEALREAAEWLEQGIHEEALRPAQRAQPGLDRLADGIQHAAEGVLGDEVEALQRAQTELQQLAEQLNQEVARATSEPAGEAGRSAPSSESTTRPASAQQPSESSASAARAQDDDNENAEAPQAPGLTQASGSTQQQETSSDRSSSPAEPGSISPGPAGSPAQSTGPMPNGQSADGAAESRSAGAGQSSAEPGAQRGGAAASSPGGGAPPDGLGGLADLIAGADTEFAPLTGSDFLEWSDRLRDVEEMLDDPELRAEAARVRDRARGVRMEYRRQSRQPQWELVKDEIARPLMELRDRIAEEVRRRKGDDPLAPIDRDPVPPQFSEQVERYYERLGRGR